MGGADSQEAVGDGRSLLALITPYENAGWSEAENGHKESLA